jgi:N utilization substance protein B
LAEPDGATVTGGDAKVFNPSRRKSRRRALDVLYQSDLRDIDPLQVLTDMLARMGADRPDHMTYAVTLVEGVAAHDTRIDELIASYAEGWTLARMPVVDRNLCRIAVYELLYNDEIDDAVAISEAVELARDLSTDDSPRFINGVLGRIAEFATP